METARITPALARRARCNDQRGSLTKLFFSENAVDVMRARAICSRCTISGLCLAAALERGEPCGVWGGEELFEGQVTVGRRRRGRPRKHALPSPLDIDEISGQPIVA